MKTKRMMTVTMMLSVFAAAGLAQAGMGADLKQETQTFRGQEKQENRDFRQTIQGLSPEEKQKAWKDHWAGQYQDRQAFREQMHEKRKDLLAAKLAKNEQLPENVRQDLIQFRETQYQENEAFRKARYEEMTTALDQVLNDTHLTPEQKKQAVQDLKRKNKSLIKEHRAKQKQENKAKREEIRNLIKTQKADSTNPSQGV